MTLLEKELMQSHLNRVSILREQVKAGTLDPSAPTQFGRGNEWKMALMTVRDEMGLAMFVQGDNPDADCDQSLITRIQTPANPCPMIRRLMVGVPRVRSMRAA